MRYAAIIVENRLIPGLQETIKQHQDMLPLDFEVWHIDNEPIITMGDYNRLLTSKRFWRNVPDKVLIFQHDSMLLRKGIEEFLKWDFIGAPIRNIPGCMNGGLSLRSKKTMMDIIHNFPYQGESIHGNEDIYFCNRLDWVGAKKPDKATAAKFSIETEFQLGSLGYHQIDSYLTPEQCEQVRGQYKV